jgi:hypothetical protein
MVIHLLACLPPASMKRLFPSFLPPDENLTAVEQMIKVEQMLEQMQVLERMLKVESNPFPQSKFNLEIQNSKFQDLVDPCIKA